MLDNLDDACKSYVGVINIQLNVIGATFSDNPQLRGLGRREQASSPSTIDAQIEEFRPVHRRDAHIAELISTSAHEHALELGLAIRN